MRDNAWIDGMCDPVPLQTSTPFEVFAVRVDNSAKALLLANESLASNEANRRANALATAHEPLGKSATPATDTFALSALIRSMVPYVDVPEPIARVLRGDETDSTLAKLTHETNARIWGVPKARRPSLALLERVFRGLLKVLGVSPSYEAHRAFIQRLITQDEVSSQLSARVVLEVASDGSWFRVQPQETQRLGSRAPLRRVLLCLIEHADRGEACDVWRLLEAGWPGERVDPEAGANRVYAAVSTLRRMGLRSVIERFDAGYRISPDAQIERQSRARVCAVNSQTLRHDPANVSRNGCKISDNLDQQSYWLAQCCKFTRRNSVVHDLRHALRGRAHREHDRVVGLARPVQVPIAREVLQHAAHVDARLVEGNRLGEHVEVHRPALAHPAAHRAGASVVRAERARKHRLVLRVELSNVVPADANVVRGIEEHLFAKLDPELSRHAPRRRRNHLQQPDRSHDREEVVPRQPARVLSGFDRRGVWPRIRAVPHPSR